MTDYPDNPYGNMQAVRDLIRHKLDVDGVSYSDSSSLNHLTYKLNDLSTVDTSTSSVSIPTYDSGVSNVYSNFNKYYTFLKAVMSRSGFSTTRVQGESWGLTTLVNRIKFTPTLTLSSTPSTVDVGDTVTVTASLDLNGSPITGASVDFYDASDDSLLDTVTTDVNGEAEYTFTYSSPLTVYCVSGETSDYINVTSRSLKISEYLYDPLLDGSESYINLNGTNATFSNNRMYNGSNILTDGWDNSTDWTLTLNAHYKSMEGNGVVVKASNSTGRDTGQILIGNFRVTGNTYLAIDNRDPSDQNQHAYDKITESGAMDIIIKIVKVTTNSSTKYQVYVDNVLKRTVTNNTLTSSARCYIGTDWRTGTNSIYIQDILVVRN